MGKMINQRDEQAERIAQAGGRKGRQVDPNNPMSPTGRGPRVRKPKATAENTTADPQPVALMGSRIDDLPGHARAGVNPDEAARERHRQRMGWFMSEGHRQGGNRMRMAKCEAFYDSEQWEYEEAQTLKDRGQEPVVYNEVKPTIDWLMGTERRTRIDFVVMAQDEGDEADEDAAIKTKILKYLDAVNQAAFERSWAAEDAFKAGIGWLEVGVRGDKSGPPVYVGAESWRNILWDSQGKRDGSDWRYLFRVKVVDYDVAIAIFPDKEVELARVVQDGDNITVASEFMGGLGSIVTGLDQFSPMADPLDDVTGRPVDFFNPRRRVLLLECWERRAVRRRPSADGLGDPVTFEIHVSIMTEHDTLIEARSPFKHDRFPFIPIWAYRNRRTGLPYSPIWPLIGPQVALNKRMSKSVFEANANQWEFDADAIDDEVMDANDIRAELNDPNGMAIYKPGTLAANKARPIQRGQYVQHQLELAGVDRMSIRAMSGVTGENRGENGNAVSGKAVLAKQDQGSLLTAELFDNLLFARKQEGDITLSVVEQYMVAPATIRVAEGIGKGEFVKINQPTNELDEQGQPVYRNDISRRQAHFVVGEQAWKQAYAEAAFESLLEVLSQLATAAPQAVINLLDLVFDMHPTLPKKRAIVQRIRDINGQTDPDAKLTPEEQAKREQQQAIAQKNFELQMALLQAQVKEAQGKGVKLDTEAVLNRLSAIYESAQAAQVISALPQVAPIADELLRSAGMPDLNGPQVIDQPQAPALTGTAAAQPQQPAGPADLPPDGAQPAPPANPAPEMSAQPGAM